LAAVASFAVVACGAEPRRTALEPLPNTAAPAGADARRPATATAPVGSEVVVDGLGEALAGGDLDRARAALTEALGELAASGECAAIAEQERYWSGRAGSDAVRAEFVSWAANHAADVGRFIGCDSASAPATIGP
jgi:hypothetical protein